MRPSSAFLQHRLPPSGPSSDAEDLEHNQRTMFPLHGGSPRNARTRWHPFSWYPTPFGTSPRLFCHWSAWPRQRNKGSALAEKESDDGCRLSQRLLFTASTSLANKDLIAQRPTPCCRYAGLTFMYSMYARVPWFISEPQTPVPRSSEPHNDCLMRPSLVNTAIENWRKFYGRKWAMLNQRNIKINVVSLHKHYPYSYRIDLLEPLICLWSWL